MNKKNYKNISIILEWIKKIIAFGDIETEKHKFHWYKNPILIDDVDINASNKVSFGIKVFEYFFGYKDNEKVKPLCVMLPKI